MEGRMMEPSTCPWCGLAKKVYVRAGSELVCTDCVKKDAAMDGGFITEYNHVCPVIIDATWMDGLPKRR